MPAVVACPKCKSKYNLPDNLVGRPVKCKSCGAMFKVGGAKQPAAAATQAKAQQTQQQTKANQAQQRELAKFGLDGPINRQPDIFGQAAAGGMDPLANHVVHDPGFAEIELPENPDGTPAQTGDEFSLFENPAIAEMEADRKRPRAAGGSAGKKKKKKKSRREKLAAAGERRVESGGGGGAGGGILGGVGFIFLLIVLNVCSYLFDWPFWVY